MRTAGTRHERLFGIAFLAALFTFASAIFIPAATVTYDPSLNTLPQAQGFTLTEDPPASPAPAVSGGILNQGLTSVQGNQFFHRSDVPFNFDDGFTLKVTLKVAFSSYDPNAGGAGSQRSGWYMEGIDLVGRRFIIGIDSAGVTLNTDAGLAVANSLIVRPFNTTDSFHQYRLVVSQGTGTLFIDGGSVGSMAIGPVVDVFSTNRVFFGDGTAGGNSQTQLSFFQYVAPPPQLGIAPGTNNVILSWPASDTNFVLQATSSLTLPIAWTSVTNEAHINSGRISVVVQTDNSVRFFRLSSP